MKKYYLFLVIIFVTAGINVNAQSKTTGSIKGKLIDTTAKQILKEATVSVVNKKDSSVVTYGVSKADGSFILENVPLGEYTLIISFQGYETQAKNIVLSADSSAIDLGIIYMQIQANNLAAVTVQAAPIQIKKDTVEFNAGMFKTKPNATAEDLLKKLPGVDVDKDGNIKAQGETVQRVLVDGKRFFGDDPKLATKNLPPDVIDKIQVFDALSDQSAFTGFDDGSRVKTINITTKKDKRKGYFGKAVGAVGNKDLYQGAFNFSKFDGNQQITVIGQANNTNQQAFTVQDILGTSSGSSGGGSRGYGGGQSGGGTRGGAGGGGGSNSQSFAQSAAGNTNNNNGITTTLAGGINYNDMWGKKTNASGSYFYNNLQTTTDQKYIQKT